MIPNTFRAANEMLTCNYMAARNEMVFEAIDLSVLLQLPDKFYFSNITEAVG
jgi:hypothetical protein